MTPLSRLLRRARPVVVALLVVAGLGAASEPVFAEGETAAPVSWSVSPADATGKDGRHSIEHELDPGASVDEHLVVRNLGAEEETFALTAADGYYNANGRFDMLAVGEESVDAGTWIDLPSTVTVAPGEAVVVPFTIAVPDDAEPGDHIAGVAASISSTQEGEGAAVGVTSRVGFRVILRVTGDIVAAYAVENLSTGYATSWNPFSPGTATVSFEIVNTGNARLSAAGVVRLAGQEVAFPEEGAPSQMLQPGDRRPFTVTVADAWPTVVLSGEVLVQPKASNFGGDDVEVSPSSVAVVVWAVPWPQLIVVIGIALIIAAVVWGRVRSRRRLQKLLAQARDEGRRESNEGGRA